MSTIAGFKTPLPGTRLIVQNDSNVSARKEWGRAKAYLVPDKLQPGDLFFAIEVELGEVEKNNQLSTYLNGRKFDYKG